MKLRNRLAQDIVARISNRFPTDRGSTNYWNTNRKLASKKVYIELEHQNAVIGNVRENLQ